MIKKLLLLSLLMSGCEALELPDKDSDEVFVTLSSGIQSSPGTRSSSISEEVPSEITRISWAIFDTKGERVKNTVSQESSVDQEDFGKFQVRLSTGTYLVVAVAHSGVGNATISSPDRVTFKNSKVTETYSVVDTLVVIEGSGELKKDITLRAVTGMARIETPVDSGTSGVSEIKFYYTGGSSTLNPRTGYGCVQSRQTEYRDLNMTDGIYRLYTFPYQGPKSSLTITATLLGSDGNEVDEVKFSKAIPVEVGKYTRVIWDPFQKTGAIGDFVIDSGWEPGDTITI